MRKICYILAICVMLWVPMASGQQQAPPNTELYYCNASVEANPDVYYFSATFPGPVRMDGHLVGRDFAQFAKDKYSLPGHVLGDCSHANSVKDRETAIDAAKFVHHAYVDTGWKPKVTPVSKSRQ